jgi:hypothetical protein
MSYSKTKANDVENIGKTIHFFTYDWNFEAVYEKPEKATARLSQYYALLTPDFSIYYTMPLALQIYNIFKSRWCGAYWQSLGLKVIPTVEWGLEESFDFCFDGIEEGSVIAVSTYCREDYKKEFMVGYNKMLETIKPSTVICYGERWPEMAGNIKVVDPYDTPTLIKKLGRDEYMKKYFAGELYPER